MEKNIRLSVDMPEKDHTKLKILASANGMTLKEFVLSLIQPVIDTKRKVNKTTQKAIEESEQGHAVHRYHTLDEFLEKMDLK